MGKKKQRKQSQKRKKERKVDLVVASENINIERLVGSSKVRIEYSFPSILNERDPQIFSCDSPTAVPNLILFCKSKMEN